ncbi:Zinc finger protein ZPR1 [Oopsacas minuta]|uniref:Zinc finger protein ZPR1 n=1 Tax=Oopsacas minuta TaxID=111878 RepID=A0AAV7JS96_9METZ|nr:Zinc finger protein ZPR1 [Oopsacas minuta]
MESNSLIYTQLGADDKPTEIESLCTSCYKQGVTKMLLKNIPLFRDIILMSFHCEYCEFANNEIMSGNPIQETGLNYIVTIKSSKDLDRQLVRSEKSVFGIPEIEFEAPPTGAKGVLTTLEGLLVKSCEELSAHAASLPVETEEEKEYSVKFKSFLAKLQDCISLKREFTFTLDDPTGNSFIEHYNSPGPDPNLVMSTYNRTPEQNKLLMVENSGTEEKEDSVDDEIEAAEDTKEKDVPAEIGADEIFSFTNPCPSCSKDCETNIKPVSVPYFKEVLLMATNCDICGYKSNEVKPSKGISEKGIRYELNMTSPADLTRDILKTHDATICIKELDITMGATTLGGKFTTIEGVISNVRDQIVSLNPFSDTSTHDSVKLNELADNLQKVKDGEKLVTLVMDDPSGNSYIQNFYAPDPDPEMLVIHYDRNEEQDSDLGLDKMKIEDYEDNIS